MNTSEQEQPTASITNANKTGTFKKYPHLQKIGQVHVTGIENGTCVIMPKLDGCTGSVWFDSKNGLTCASKNLILTKESENRYLHKYIHQIKKDTLSVFFNKHGTRYILFGEWLVSHSFKGYVNQAWNRLYIFDVFDTVESKYMPYDVYAPLLLEFQIEHIPVIAVLVNPTEEQLLALLDKATFLCEADLIGEGIIIKNYDFINNTNRSHPTYAKIIRSEFKEAQKRNIKPVPKETIEQSFIRTCVTDHFVEKIYSKIVHQAGGIWQQKDIGQLFTDTFADLITEEFYDFISKPVNKKAVVDFGELRRLCDARVRDVKRELFPVKIKAAISKVPVTEKKAVKKTCKDIVLATVAIATELAQVSDTQEYNFINSNEQE